jgi:hypothetical protein
MLVGSATCEPQSFWTRNFSSLMSTTTRGGGAARRQITASFSKDQVSSIPHTEVMSKIDEAGKTFRMLFNQDRSNDPLHFGLHAFGVWLYERRRGAKDQNCHGSRQRLAAQLVTCS